jgi:hypothetical protein
MLEKSTSTQRAQFAVIVSATRSTEPSLAELTRLSYPMTLIWILSGSPKTAWAICRPMSTSKPSILPVNELRELNNSVSWLVPRIRKPRFWISAM